MPGLQQGRGVGSGRVSGLELACTCWPGSVGFPVSSEADQRGAPFCLPEPGGRRLILGQVRHWPVLFGVGPGEARSRQSPRVWLREVGAHCDWARQAGICGCLGKSQADRSAWPLSGGQCHMPCVVSSGCVPFLGSPAPSPVCSGWASARSWSDPEQGSGVFVGPLTFPPPPLSPSASGTTSLLRAWHSAVPRPSWCGRRAPCAGGRQP